VSCKAGVATGDVLLPDLSIFNLTPIALISLLENHLENNGYNNGSVGDMEEEWMDGLAGRAPQVPSPKIKFSRRAESQRVDS
jgi:hypothetical protein